MSSRGEAASSDGGPHCPRALFAQIAGLGLVLTAIGGTIGLAGALGAGRLLSGLLVDTAAADPLTIGAVAALLPAMTLAACTASARHRREAHHLCAIQCGWGTGSIPARPRPGKAIISVSWARAGGAPRTS
jgi:hypothetical protein